jgi:hypothetical protein
MMANPMTCSMRLRCIRSGCHELRLECVPIV